MRIIVSLVAALAIMAGIVLLIVMAGATVARSTESAISRAPMTYNTLSKVAFALLWLLVAGTSAGWIGAD